MNDKKLEQLAQQAYIYFYPFVSMEMTRLQFIYTAVGDAPAAGPMNVLGHFRTFPDADVKTVIRLNFDTLYSTGWIDLTDGPVVLSVGENTEKRYYELPLYDMWSDSFAIPGSRVNGYEAKNFLVAPTDWKGDVPEDLEVIVSPTKYIWLIGRTQANGLNDPSLHQYQDTMTLMPLQNWLSKEPFVATLPEQRNDIDIKTPVTLLVNQMDAEQFYNLAMDALVNNPPHLSDWSLYNQLQQIGIVPGRKFTELDASVQEALQQGVKSGLALMYERAQQIGLMINGWQIYHEVMGVYGNEYLKRAIIALFGLGANPVEEAIYPFSTGDQNGDPLVAEHEYIIHFDKDNLPPVGAFWSITLYDVDGYQVANEINRFAVGDRDDLMYEEDGSLNLYIQKVRPSGEKEKNWLPTPQSGEFNLTMRLYEPSSEVATLQWVPPVIQKM